MTLKKKQQVASLLAEVDADGNGSLDFADFLRMMRQFQNMQDAHRIAKEQNAKEITQFNPVEVEAFREIFVGKERKDGSFRSSVSFEEFAGMIGNIIFMNEGNHTQLKDIFNLNTDRSEDEVDTDRISDGGRTADFPEFLLLMHRILKDNFGGIQESSKAIAEREQKHRQHRKH